MLEVATAAILALVLVWNWDWFIPFVERTASAALARPVTVEHLHVHIARNPVLEADGVVIGNPLSFLEGSKLAEIGKLALTVDAPAYLSSRHLVLLGIEVDHPVVEATQLRDGRNNWALGSSATAASGTQWPVPTIGDLRINDGHVHFVVPRLNSDFNLDVSTQAPDKDKQGGDEPKLVVDAHGTYAAQPVSGQFVGGALLSLRRKDRPYPVDLHLENGAARVSLVGTLQNPLAFAGANLKLDLSGPSLDRLTPLSGVALPETLPFHLSGDIDYADNRIRFRYQAV
jgi:uncharacterized protein involved in outer membrane biogenesis